MKKFLIILFILLLAGAAAAVVYSYRKTGNEVQVTTLPLSRGDVVRVVGATGTLEAVTTVTVGSQVSGTVKELYADFNSIVKKGQVIAKLDPSLFETQIEQAKANVVRSETDLERLKVSLEDARAKLRRAESLAAKKLNTAQDLESAQVAVRQAEASLKSQMASLEQAKASLNQNIVNLQHTIITAPIDGIVISRNVDIGQTVAASMSAPTLFLIAEDLRRMQARASVDESDVGLIRPGQVARFRVDAYPSEEFVGTVKQVRLQPTVVQNVVTYITVIDVPNPELKLKPGMTAVVNIEIARRNNALRVPNAALRFRPTAETFAALNLPVPPELQRGGQAGRQGGIAGGSRDQQGGGRGDRAAAGGTRGEGNNARAGAAMTDEERARMRERFQNMTPADRERAMAQFQGRGGSAGSSPAPATSSRPVGARQASAKPVGITLDSAQTIDALFGPLQFPETRGRVWLWENKQLKMVNVRLGISDGTYTELVSNDLQPGQELVTEVITAQTSGTSTVRPNAASPFMPGGGRGQPGGFPGMPGGGGGRR